MKEQKIPNIWKQLGIEIKAGKGLAGGGKLAENPEINVIASDESLIIDENSMRVNIVNDLITGGINTSLSSEQGKILKQLIDAIGEGGTNRLLKSAEALGEFEYLGTLPPNGKDIAVGTNLFNPKLWVDGIRIESTGFTVDLQTGFIQLVEPYAKDYSAIWLVEDQFPHHISFCFPTIGLLINDTATLSKIKLGTVIKILGTSEEDDGGAYLVKCEGVSKLNPVNIGNGRFLNEIPNTKISDFVKKTQLATNNVSGLVKIGKSTTIHSGYLETSDFDYVLNPPTPTGAINVDGVLVDTGMRSDYNLHFVVDIYLKSTTSIPSNVRNLSVFTFSFYNYLVTGGPSYVSPATGFFSPEDLGAVIKVFKHGGKIKFHISGIRTGGALSTEIRCLYGHSADAIINEANITYESLPIESTAIATVPISELMTKEKCDTNYLKKSGDVSTGQQNMDCGSSTARSFLYSTYASQIGAFKGLYNNMDNGMYMDVQGTGASIYLKYAGKSKPLISCSTTTGSVSYSGGNFDSDTTIKGSPIWTDATNSISKSTNGWVKFANGLIIQWGTDYKTGMVPEEVRDINFPISFTEVTFVSAVCTTGTAKNVGYINTKTIRYTNTTSNNATHWLAIGY